MAELRREQDMAKKSSELATRKPYSQQLAERIENLRQGGFLGTVDASEDVMDEMTERILSASDEDEILGGTVPISTLEGAVIKITDANFRESSYREHDYAVFRWEAADGRKGVSTNGGPRLVAQLVRAVELRRIPGWTVRVGSADVEFEPGQHGRTYFFQVPR